MKKILIGFLMVALMTTVAYSCNAFPSSCDDSGSGYEDVDYYGCPNSKRIKRLNTKKERRFLHI